MDQTELDLREILHILRRRLWLLLLMPAVAAVTAGVVSLYLLAPVYSASATLWVVKDYASGQVTYNDVLMNQNLTKTYAEVAKSRTVLAGALEALRTPDLTVKDLQEKLTVTAVRDTQILSFTVTDGDPARAARLADAVAESFRREIVSFMKVENVKIVDHALIPASKVKPRPITNTVIASVMGLMAAMGLVFLLEFLDTSLKTPEDVTRHIGLPVLGTIPDIDGKAAGYVHKPQKAMQSDTVVEK